MKARLLIFFLLSLCIAPVTHAATPVSGYTVVAEYPHSTSSYTEGFFYLNGLFYEGTGIEGHSAVMSLYPLTGKPILTHTIAPKFFGEGIVNFGNQLYEWTWQTHVGFVYDLATLQPIREFHYTGEGWGMTQNGSEIITSDGSNTLRFRTPATFAVTRSLVVHDGAQKIDLLNELEWVKGEIYANVWHTNRIARISPRDGHVIGWIDLTGILPPGSVQNPEAVLNGIAYDAQHDRLFVTGKEWPTIFEIKLVPRK
jgi:glutamine cyclotransferase